MLLVFLLEEKSMEALLEKLLPRFLPEDVSPVYVSHEGKSDLERSIPRKLRAWQTPNSFFVVVRDQDAADCKDVRKKLLELCDEGTKPDTLVRVAVRNLESWVLGDLAALARAFNKPKLAGLQAREKFRNPDKLANPTEELKKLVPDYQKVSGARAVGTEITLAEDSRSGSYNAFLRGVRRLLKAQGMGA